jgi:hypothetical protein
MCAIHQQTFCPNTVFGEYQSTPRYESKAFLKVRVHESPTIALKGKRSEGFCWNIELSYKGIMISS